VIKFNNINGSMRIRTSMDIGKLKQAGSAFRMYLQSKIVYINKAQLGIEEGVTLGWLHQAHPAFCYREDIKERLIELMGEEHSNVCQRKLHPPIIDARLHDHINWLQHMVSPVYYVEMEKAPLDACFCPEWW
jgi:hypothetical protein